MFQKDTQRNSPMQTLIPKATSTSVASAATHTSSIQHPPPMHKTRSLCDPRIHVRCIRSNSTVIQQDIQRNALVQTLNRRSASAYAASAATQAPPKGAHSATRQCKHSATRRPPPGHTLRQPPKRKTRPRHPPGSDTGPRHHRGFRRHRGDPAEARHVARAVKNRRRH